MIAHKKNKVTAVVTSTWSQCNFRQNIQRTKTILDINNMLQSNSSQKINTP